MPDPAQPVAGLSPEHRGHVRRIVQARQDPWGDPHGGGLATAVTDAHRAGVPHPVIAHYSGFPVERIARMSSFAKNGDPFGLAKGKNSAQVRLGGQLVRQGLKGIAADKDNRADAAKLGAAAGLVGAGAGAAAVARARRGRAKADVAKKVSDPNGNAFQRPSGRNTRGQNVAVGATVAGGTLGVPAAALGAVAGKNRAKSGVRLLHSVGAGPGRAATARIVAGHAGRQAGRAGAALGGVGAAYGALVGASISHRRDNKKLPVGRVRKSDRHMDPAPQQYRMSGALPKHSAGAQAVEQAAARKRPLPVAAAVRGTLRATAIGKSAFDPVPVGKSAFGSRGDKRNTKYAAATLAGTTVGSQAGKRTGARAAGTTMEHVYDQTAAHFRSTVEAAPERGVLRAVGTALKRSHGARSALIGDVAGSVAGGAAAATVLHRRRAGRGVAKSALGAEAIEKKKIGLVLAGQRVPLRPFEPKRLPTRAVRDANGRGAQGQRRAVRDGRV